MSVENYFRLDTTVPDVRYEFYAGTIQMMAGGSKEHDDIAFNLRAALKQHFYSGPCSVQGSDMRVQLNENFYVYPDVTVTCDVADRRRGNKLIRSPRIVVEVLSPSTEKNDRTDKFAAYQACPTIEEIVLVSQFAPHVEVYRRSDDGWRTELYGPDEEIRLESLDISISIDEVYAGIDFNEPLAEEK
jgi:Uma2 family endonuclease